MKAPLLAWPVPLDLQPPQHPHRWDGEEGGTAGPQHAGSSGSRSVIRLSRAAFDTAFRLLRHGPVPAYVWGQQAYRFLSRFGLARDPPQLILFGQTPIILCDGLVYLRQGFVTTEELRDLLSSSRDDNLD